MFLTMVLYRVPVNHLSCCILLTEERGKGQGYFFVLFFINGVGTFTGLILLDERMAFILYG